MNKTTSIILSIVVVIVLGVGIFFYVTRPAAAPSGNTVPNQVAETDANKTNYKISNDSKATFTINEVLNGKPFTAVGETSAISGTISLDESGNLSVGTISINARTFKTDSERRDGAIARFILKSEDPANELITFTPTSSQKVDGVKPYYEVTGDLKIAGITKPTSFTVTLSEKNGVIVGDAVSTIKRSDFNLTIPNVPFVASVSDEFTITAMVYANKI